VETTATILLAEDNPDDVALFRWAIQKAGLTNPIQAVSDGEQAIQYLKGEDPYSDRIQFPFPGLVFLDLQMPVKTGLDVLVWIRQQQTLQKLPVIVLTASSFDSTIRTAYVLGANSFLTKPANFTDFTAEIKQLAEVWLARSASQSSPPAATPSGVTLSSVSPVPAPPPPVPPATPSKDPRNEAAP
jgi:CheY-like chemotaxis protein